MNTASLLLNGTASRAHDCKSNHTIFCHMAFRHEVQLWHICDQWRMAVLIVR